MCTQPLNEQFKEGIITDSRLKYNLLCKFANEAPLEDKIIKVCPSTRAIKSKEAIPSLVDSSNESEDDSVPDEPLPLYPFSAHALAPHYSSLPPPTPRVIDQIHMSHPLVL